jgi:protein-tyrosine phosphatase
MITSPLQGCRQTVANQYGHKMGWLLHHAWNVVFGCGGFRRLKAVDFGRVARLVFVCYGNICRSPYAEARARSLHLDAASFGLQSKHRCKADSIAMRVAASRGLDLRSHLAKSAQGIALGTGDLLIAMEPSQLKPMLSIANSAGAQVTLLGLWCSPVRPYLQDPYGLTDGYFQNCFSLIDSAVWELRQRMRPQILEPSDLGATV